MAELITIKTMTDSRGSLSVIENEIGFPIKRVFYIYDVASTEVRGGHAHKENRMALISLSGTCKIRILNQHGEKIYFLDQPNKCLLLNPEDWHEMFDYQEKTTLLVLASHSYDPNDYVFEKPL